MVNKHWIILFGWPFCKLRTFLRVFVLIASSIPKMSRFLFPFKTSRSFHSKASENWTHPSKFSPNFFFLFLLGFIWNEYSAFLWLECLFGNNDLLFRVRNPFSKRNSNRFDHLHQEPHKYFEFWIHLQRKVYCNIKRLNCFFFTLYLNMNGNAQFEVLEHPSKYYISI